MSEGPAPSGGRLEFQRQNLWVGLFVLAAAAVFIAVAAVAIQERMFRREYLLRTSFPRIEGLKPGAEVFLRGYPVGRVAAIRLATDPDVHFDVEFTVEEAVKLPAGTRARLSTRGFATKVLDLVTPGDPTDPAAPPAPAAGHAPVNLVDGSTVPGTGGADLDALFSDVLVLTRRASQTLDRVDALLAETIGPEVRDTLRSLDREVGTAAEDLRATLRRSRDVLGEAGSALAENRPKAGRLLDLATEDLESAGSLMRRMDAALAAFEERILPLADELGSGLAKADAILTRADASLSEEDLRETLANLRAVSEKANLLVDELRRRPWRLLRRVRGEKKALLEEMAAREKAAAPEAP